MNQSLLHLSEKIINTPFINYKTKRPLSMALFVNCITYTLHIHISNNNGCKFFVFVLHPRFCFLLARVMDDKYNWMSIGRIVIFSYKSQ